MWCTDLECNYVVQEGDSAAYSEDLPYIVSKREKNVLQALIFTCIYLYFSSFCKRHFAISF